MSQPSNRSTGPNPPPKPGGQFSGDSASERFANDVVVIIQRERVRMPIWTVADFCQQFNLSHAILRQLQDQGFETTGGLLEVSDASLAGAKFKPGHIAEIKRALKEFLSEHGRRP
ncbi:hypothetical protein DFH09DRAFT_1100111 [Mycena vulgaris]|nr:hypothetical protein DFH09DRAFT_1100111 [Mycena vulgaris]